MRKKKNTTSNHTGAVFRVHYFGVVIFFFTLVNGWNNLKNFRGDSGVKYKKKKEKSLGIRVGSIRTDGEHPMNEIHTLQHNHNLII